MICERKNIFAAFAKRRNRDLQNVEAEKKIFSELASSDRGLEINVCECDEASFDAKRFRSTKALEGTLLQDAQQFCLRARRESGDFVEDDGAGAAELEAAEFAVNGSGEGAPFVAKEFAFDEIGRKRGAVDFEKRSVTARAEFVNKTREMVLARAGFAGNEKRCGRRRDFLRELEQAERSGSGGDRGKPVGHEVIVATAQGSGLAACDGIAESDTESDRKATIKEG